MIDNQTNVKHSEPVGMLDEVYKYFTMMERNNILLLFKGAVSSDLLTSILQITETKLESMQERPKVRKRVFNVLVECLQNVYLHMDKKKGIPENAMLVLGKKDENYFIVTGNHILREKADNLKKRLDNLNALSHEELKTLYTEVLMNEEMDEEGGAGLGLIDIIRKSKSKVDYKFENVNDKHCFFSLHVNIAN